jgi:hypothetical protein
VAKIIPENEEPAAENLLDFIPQPAIPWDVAADGLVTLRVAKYSNPWLLKHLVPRLKHPHVTLHLDSFGTWVWKRMDGRNTVREIGAALELEFGETIQPVYQRLGLFINMLAQRSYVSLQKPEAGAPAEPVSLSEK